MDFNSIIYKRRTIRRFKQDAIPTETLRALVDYARLAPAGGNNQGLEYVIVKDKAICGKLFELVKWAGNLPEHLRTPEQDRRPTAYIAVLFNTSIKKGAEADAGAAVENILLGAVTLGLGACWMGAIDRGKIHKLLGLPTSHEVGYVISLGYPDEESVMEKYQGDFKYWKDDSGKMHVPKRSLDEIIFKLFE
nr:nitroreductase family protein [Candidatus Sigynarchaeum springense]